MLNLNISKQNKRLYLLCLVATLAISSIGFYIYSQRYLSTEDAYVNANVAQIASRVTGQISRIYIDNNQFVRQGQLLFELDAIPFRVEVAKVKAQLAMDESSLKNAQSTADRTMVLVNKKNLSIQSGDDALAKLQSAIAAVQLSKARLEDAELNLRYTQVLAPTDGWVSNMSLQVGNIAQANQPLFAVISNAIFWVDANFKETELANIQPGQIANIKTDMYPSHPFEGMVESISRGSGNAFSLLPPQNATGNWVKVTQRVPVRIRILNPDSKQPLRIGTTATVTVDTHRKKC